MNDIFQEVNEAICTAKRGTVIFEDIPVGLGKTTNIFKEIVPWALMNHISLMLVSPRVALCDNCQTMLRNYALDNGYFIEEVEACIKVYTLQALVTMLKGKAYLPTADIVIWDEAQGLTTESTILPGSTGIVNKIIDDVYNRKNVNVFMSGSGEVFFTDFEKRVRSRYKRNAREVLMQEIRRFSTEADFSYIIPRFFKEEADVMNIIRSAEPGEKTMVFVDSIAFGEKLLNDLSAEGISAKFISSKNINNERATLRQINMLNSFSQRVLICTSVLMVGISICATSVKHVVVFPMIKENTIQMAARRRRSRKKQNDYINVYFCSRTKEHFATMLEYELDQVNCYEAFRKEINVSAENVVGFLLENSKRVNDYANCYYRTSCGLKFNELGYAEHIRLAKIYKQYCEELEENEHFFEREVLKWFGLENKEIQYFSSDYMECFLDELIKAVREQIGKKASLKVEEGKAFLNSLRPIIRRLDMSYEKKKQLMPDAFNEFCSKFGLGFRCDNKNVELNKNGTVYHFTAVEVDETRGSETDDSMDHEV